MRFRAREYEKFDWLAAVPDGKVVYLVGKGEPAQGARRRSRSLVTVALAAVRRAVARRHPERSRSAARRPHRRPRRRRAAARRAAPRQVAASKRGRRRCRPGISELLARAEASLAAGNCEEYYNQFMSPNFNKATSRSARKTLITACTNNESTRETMITTLRVVQELAPKYDLDGARAIYDVSGQGLPYERFVLERDKDMRWYIAE